MRALSGVLLVVALAGGCSAGETTRAPTPGGPAPTGDRPATPTADGHSALRRPWARPTIPAGARCPVTTARSRPDPALAPLLGDGPARPAGLTADAVLDYLGPDRWTDRSWGGQKVLWAVEPTVTGPVLIRGRQLDGPNDVAFEDPAIPELLLRTDSYQPADRWRDNPSFTRIRSPGCYAYQVDTVQGTWTVVFRARGPKV